MTSDNAPVMNRELMWVEHPAGTRLSRSSTPGGFSALVRNDDNGLDTHAVLFRAGDVVKTARTKGFIVGIAVCIAVALAVKATPHVKNRFNDFKSKLNRKSEYTGEADAQETDMGVEEPRSGNRRSTLRDGRHITVA